MHISQHLAFSNLTDDNLPKQLALISFYSISQKYRYGMTILQVIYLSFNFNIYCTGI